MEYVIEGYIARDKDGALFWHSNKPSRFHEDGLEYWANGGYRFLTPLQWGMYSELKWEDEPIPVAVKFEQREE